VSLRSPGPESQDDFEPQDDFLIVLIERTLTNGPLLLNKT
jgi:hypothetical protein